MRLFFRFCGSFSAVVAAVTLLAPGCSNQSEGDRCDFGRNGHQDCEPPLICVQANQLNDTSTDRCCPQEGQPISDDRCQPRGLVGTGGDAGKDVATDSETGADGEDGSDAADGDAATCAYNSDCPGTLVCGPTGVCQLQCVNSKDCGLGQKCNTTTNLCELDVPDAGGD